MWIYREQYRDFILHCSHCAASGNYSSAAVVNDIDEKEFDRIHEVSVRLKDIFLRDNFTFLSGSESYLVKAVEEAIHKVNFGGEKIWV